MPIKLIVRHDNAALARKLRASVRRYPRALAAGINRTARLANTRAVREIQADVGASSQKTIRRNLKIKTATAQKPVANIVARSGKKDRIPIYELRPKPRAVTKRKPTGGVSYGPGRKLIPGSFIARLKSGHIGVFKRIDALGSRLPITELLGPSVALVLGKRNVSGKIRKFIRDTAPREIARAFRFVSG